MSMCACDSDDCRPKDWRALLRESFESEDGESCHGGCGDRARVLRLTGKHTGAFCRSCWDELSRGKIPPLDQPKGLKRGPSRRALME